MIKYELDRRPHVRKSMVLKEGDVEHYLYPLICCTDKIPGVNRGDRGGYVAEGTLSHEGTCWVHDHSMVHPGVHIRDDAQIKSTSVIMGDVDISGDTLIDGSIVIAKSGYKICFHAEKIIRTGVGIDTGVLGGEVIKLPLPEFRKRTWS